MSALRDMFAPFPLLNSGISAYPNGANLNFNITAGMLYGMGINWGGNQKNPNQVSVAAATPKSFYYRTRLGGTTGAVTLINSVYYDVDGTITVIPGTGTSSNNQVTNQRIYVYPTGVINVQYGQQLYSSMANALAGQQTENFVRSPNATGAAVLIGVLAIRRGTVSGTVPNQVGNTVLNDIVDAIFTPASIFGESMGGVNGISTTTLQQAYHN